MVKISAVAHKIKMAPYANSQSVDLNFERSFLIGWCSYSRDSQTQDEAAMKFWFYRSASRTEQSIVLERSKRFYKICAL